MTGSGPSGTGHHRLDVQGLRAAAVAAVVLYHAGVPLPGGYLGVDVFFVVSGFVITGLLARERASTGRTDLRHFYARRFRRLVPALSVMVVATLAVSLVVLSPLGPLQTAVLTGVGAILFSANVVIARSTGDYFGVPAETNPLLHTWSLSVEEQFYLVVPMLLVTTWGLVARSGSRPSRRWPAAATTVGALTVVSLALAAVAALAPTGTAPGVLGFYSTVTRAWEFGAGALVALLGSRAVPGRSTPALAGSLGAVLVAASFVAPTGGGRIQLVATVTAVLGTVLVVLAGGWATTSVTRVLSSRGFVGLGDRSYSVYLWHWPVIVLASLVGGGAAWVAPAAAAASVPLAFASYRWVEQPFRRPGPDGRPVLALVVGATVVPVLAVAALAVPLLSSRVGEAPVRALAAADVSPAAVAHGCDTPTVRLCTWPAQGAAAGPAPGTVHLVGDSHAGHYSDGVVAAARLDGRPTSATMSYSCPFVPGLAVSLDTVTTDCRDRNDALLAELLAEPPGTVLVANADTYWSDPRWVAAGPSGDATTDTDAKLSLLRTALSDTASRLRTAGHRVVLLQSVPLHVDYRPERCTLSVIRAGECHDTVSLDSLTVGQGRVRVVLDEVATATGARAFDPWPLLCEGASCSTDRDGVALYRNWSHLSVAASRDLAPALLAVLGGAG
ncbi:acyltransferase family protein [Oryzobacter sp. R7]|uniref:acyltransferase family protein n=1 Tax=Oryzobacter faecalis TaxID=3388656 RepID=UPI00398D41DA